jgi:hypothetical protein
MPPNIWPVQSFATSSLAYYGLLKRLIEVDGAYKIVEAYDADNAGTKRRLPTAGDEYNLSNAAFAVGGTFGFDTGLIGAGDWIVIESTDSPTHQIYWENDSATQWLWALIPLGDFTTGGADVSPPVFSTTTVAGTMGTTPTLIAMVLQAASMDYTLWSDNSTMAVAAWDSTSVANTRYMYAGAALSDVPGDTRPFVIQRAPANTQWTNVQNQMSRLCPDGATFSGGGTNLVYTSAFSVVMTAAGYDNLATPSPAKYHIFPGIVFFDTASHRHPVVLKWTGVAGASLNNRGTLDNLSKVYFTSAAAEARRVLDWDGTTAV